MDKSKSGESINDILRLAVANEASGVDQSIVISGVSGSGKTEAAKHILQYLVFSNKKAHQKKNSQSLLSASISIYLLEKPRAIFSQNSLLSSFHAFRLLFTSLSNDQWKRYGLTSVLPSPERLEQPVSVCQESLTWPNLLDALTSLGFNQDDVDQLICLLLAIYLLNMVEFLPASPQSKSRSLSLTDESGSTAMISPSDVSKVRLAGRLLGLTGQLVEQFSSQLITRRVQAGHGASGQRRMTVYSTTCSLSQAQEQRDCLVKALYKGLFDNLVTTINDNLSTHSKAKNPSELCAEIGILDLFGFENFTANSFEQFCINYANERLQAEFMRVAVNSAYDQLVSEGLKPAHSRVQSAGQSLSLEETLLASCNNSTLITAMETCASLLDEVCLLNRVHRKTDRYQSVVTSPRLDSREIDWLHRTRTHFSCPSNYPARPAAPLPDHGKTSFFRLPSLPVTPSRSKFRSPMPTKANNRKLCPIRVSNAVDCFTVEHYTGFVTYSAEKFVSKNLDHLPAHLLTWLAESQCPGSPTLDDRENRMPSCTLSDSHETLGVFSIKELLDSIVKNLGELGANPSTPTYSRDQSEERKVNTTPLRAINATRDPCARFRGCSPLTRDQLKKNWTVSPTRALASNSLIHRPVSRRKHTVFGDFKVRQPTKQSIGLRTHSRLPGVRIVSCSCATSQSSVNSLLEKLGCHQVSFVRCLRVNCDQAQEEAPVSSALVKQGDKRLESGDTGCTQANTANWEFVRSQVISGGLLAAATILNSTFPVRYSYGEFMSRYQTLWRLCHFRVSSDGESFHRHLSNTDFDALLNRYLEKIQLPCISKYVSSQQLHRETGDCVIQQQQQRIVLLLLTVGLGLGCQQLMTRPAVDPDPSISQLIGQFGRSVLFLTGCQVDRLDTLRQIMRNSAARLLQRSKLIAN